jgi:hypothetical protein
MTGSRMDLSFALSCRFTSKADWPPPERRVPAAAMRPAPSRMPMSPEKSVEEMRIESLRRGYAFAIVRPRGDRNFDARSVPIVFAIDEGPRT